MDALFDNRAFALMRQSVVCAAIALVGVEALVRVWGVEQAGWRARFRILVMALAALLPVGLWLVPGLGRRPLLLDTALWGELRLWGALRLDAVLAVVMWMSGAAFLGQEAVPALRHATRERRAPVPPSPELAAEVAAVGRLVGVAPPPVEVVEEDEPHLGVRGVVRPRLVVSTGVLQRLDAEERAGAMAHELAHVARGDTRRGIAVAVLRAALIFNPFALVTFRRALQDAEVACDDVAAIRGGERLGLGLASALAKFYRFEQVPPAGRALHPRRLLESLEDAAHRRLIEERVERLLHPRPPRRSPPGPIRFTLAALGLGAVLCLIG